MLSLPAPRKPVKFETVTQFGDTSIFPVRSIVA
jgi:hypothetical protein